MSSGKNPENLMIGIDENYSSKFAIFLTSATRSFKFNLWVQITMHLAFDLAWLVLILDFPEL
jgi:hypothetical protein